MGSLLLMQNKYTDNMLLQSCRTVANAWEATSDIAAVVQDSQIRYTLVDGDGTVLFDSETGEFADF